MKNYRFLNNLFGWIAFLVAAFVYLSTIEPTASFWDCGEYIATAFKLEVGHPPGAPLFNIIGRFFTLFTDPEHAALAVNAVSALSSAFTILFLFWTITYFVRKIVKKTPDAEFSAAELIAIIGSGLVGSLAYTFTDSFWFSAVEGEVYAMSSFFTAIVFWAILKWEEISDQPYNERWLVLIAYLIGLSIGVHLLNLLAIPAIVFVYYFKNYKPTQKGFFITLLISVAILGTVQAGVIPLVVKWSAKFELFFVNTLGLPFNSGTIVYFIALVAFIVWALNYTRKHNKYVWNTITLSFTFLLIGYSSFIVLVIRSQANTPMDENNPENAINLLAYLNREQYGDWPIVYGQYFNAPYNPESPYKDGNPVYVKDEKLGKYIISDERKNSIPNYDPAFSTLFPRMYSSQSNHVSGYKQWGKVQGTPVRTTNMRGESEVIMKPTFGENLRYFFTYQIGHMYGRYFMWNFAGRQNDIQGHGGILKGNWISGIKGIDAMRLGNQDKLPKSMTSNKGMNKFYFLPLILGLIGLFFHFNRNKSDAFVVTLLFLLTGLAIVIYLNQTPYQPRERDYAYAASFYAFSIWIGVAVYAIYDFLSRKTPRVIAASFATVLCLLAGPIILAKDGWNDHNRSKRYTARDFAYNYLNSCEPNAILFTNGDNDTFPLWYAQEVEGIRTDVRVVNLSLSNTDWYIEQMRRKAYDSDPIPLTLQEHQYRQGTRDYVPIYENPSLQLDTSKYYNIKEILDFISSEDPKAKVETGGGDRLNYLPTRKISIPVDTNAVVQSGLVSAENKSRLKSEITWDIKKSYLLKNDLMIFDILATNNWKRPVYFAITVGDDSYLDLEEYFQLEGLAYKLVPYKTQSADGQTGEVATIKMYDRLMNAFKWGGMDKQEIYMDENNLRMTMNFRNNFARLADELIRTGKKDMAVKALDKCIEVMPENNVPYNFFLLPVIDSYYKADAPQKANALVKRLADIYEDDLNYYFSLKGEFATTIDYEKQQAMSVMQRLLMLAKTNKQDALAADLEKRFAALESKYMGGPGSNPGSVIQ